MGKSSCPSERSGTVPDLAFLITHVFPTSKTMIAFCVWGICVAGCWCTVYLTYSNLYSVISKVEMTSYLCERWRTAKLLHQNAVGDDMGGKYDCVRFSPAAMAPHGRATGQAQGRVYLTTKHVSIVLD